jgi:aspartate/methionine/tyrosine aminotransferase
VAVTPGRDFGSAQTRHFVRFSTANSMAQLQEAAGRLRAVLA